MKRIPAVLMVSGITASLLAGFAIYKSGIFGASDLMTQESHAEDKTFTATSETSKQSTDASMKKDTATNKSGAGVSDNASVAYDDSNANYPTLDYRLTEMQARRNGETFDREKVLAALAMPSPWVEDASVMTALPADADQDDGRAFIRYEPLKVEALMPGDELTLPVPQESQEFRMVVETVEAHGDGVVTWRGHLKDFTEQNQVSISQANGNTQIGIFTPNAHYQAEIFGTQGWVVNSGNLFKGGDVVIHVSNGVEGPTVTHGENGEHTIEPIQAQHL